MPGVIGTWRGNLAEQFDQCGVRIDPNPQVHEISIDGTYVSLTTSDGTFYEGYADSENGFTVQHSDEQAFPTITTIKYSSIINGVAQVHLSQVYSRPGGCETRWFGQMRRG